MARSFAWVLLFVPCVAGAGAGNWTAHTGLNCYNGHGGIPVDPADPYTTGLTVSQCEAACVAKTGCAAIVREAKDQGNCWLRSWYNIDSCQAAAGSYDTYIIDLPPYVSNFPMMDNAYKIKLPEEDVRNNSFIFEVADFGLAAASSQTGMCCQVEVADQMRAKRKELESQGKKLLFIAAGGDNFYWTGLGDKGSSQGSDQWQRWLNVYKGLTDVPWLAVHGNHDLGDTDPYSVCPDQRTRVTIAGQKYGGNQLDEDKGGHRMGGDTLNFHLPDFNYYYRLDALNFEFFALDQNYVDVGGIGGNEAGHSAVGQNCGGDGAIQRRLESFQASGEAMMQARAAEGAADPKSTRNVLVLQHYPGQCDHLEKLYRAAAPSGEMIDFRCAYGHTHTTECDQPGDDGCIYSMVGGGGGCCSSDVVHGGAGFGVLHFKEGGGFTQDLVHGGNCNFDPSTSNVTALRPCPWTGAAAEKCRSDLFGLEL